MTKVYSQFHPRRTPQKEQARFDQIKNEAGGYGFLIDRWQRLNRFLFLGTEGGTFYVKEQALTVENAKNVLACIKEDGIRVVETIREFSTSGRTFRQSPLLFALALASTEGDEKTRQKVYSYLPDICRIPTHLFEFVGYRENFGGWGRGMRRAVSNWYSDLTADRLAYLAVKYQSRNGWSNADLIRLSHPKPDEETANIFKWILGKETDELPEIIDGFEQAKRATKVSEITKLVVDCGLPREAIPTQFLNNKEVWEALLQTMPLTAMIRNLGKMTEIGLLTTTSQSTRFVVDKLRNQEALKKARVHPMAVLFAHTTYSQGHGFRGHLRWNPVRQILDVTDEAFYLSFGNVEPTGKRIALAVDESASMNAMVADSSLDCKTAAVAQALITLNVEPDVVLYAFDTKIREVPISSRQRLDDAVRLLNRGNGTNCSLPMNKLQMENIERDAIVIYTDHETWHDGGRMFGTTTASGHPFEALDEYRRNVQPDAKLATVAMAATKTTVGDVTDTRFLELVGLDSNAPLILSNFINDKI